MYKAINDQNDPKIINNDLDQAPKVWEHYQQRLFEMGDEIGEAFDSTDVENILKRWSGIDKLHTSVLLSLGLEDINSMFEKKFNKRAKALWEYKSKQETDSVDDDIIEMLHKSQIVEMLYAIEKADGSSLSEEDIESFFDMDSDFMKELMKAKDQNHIAIILKTYCRWVYPIYRKVTTNKWADRYNKRHISGVCIESYGRPKVLVQRVKDAIAEMVSDKKKINQKIWVFVFHIMELQSAKEGNQKEEKLFKDAVARLLDLWSEGQDDIDTNAKEHHKKIENDKGIVSIMNENGIATVKEWKELFRTLKSQRNQIRENEEKIKKLQDQLSELNTENEDLTEKLKSQKTLTEKQEHSLEGQKNKIDTLTEDLKSMANLLQLLSDQAKKNIFGEWYTIPPNLVQEVKTTLSSE